MVRAVTDHGMSTGEREIDPVQAATVIRIFQDYSSGDSPKAIAKRLNAEGIAGPSGGSWGPSTIYGNTAAERAS